MSTPAFGGVLGYDASLASDPLATGTYSDAIVGGSLALSNNGSFKAANYSLVVLPGDLKVVNGTFEVTLKGGDWTYDGDPHGPTLTGTTLVTRLPIISPTVPAAGRALARPHRP